MSFGISLLSVVPIRKEQKEQSEMISQLLFGETVEIIEKNKSWIYIRALFDDYEGWIDEKMITTLSNEDFNTIQNSKHLVLDRLQIVKKDSNFLYLLPGSSIPNYNPNSTTFEILAHTFHFIEQPKHLDNKSYSEIGKEFLNAPYLWGGRSLFGIDCSGFTQNVYKVKGIALPRDASQQVAKGKTVDFITDIKEGDLAFFDNEDGVITHVGIVLNSNEIIHASGQVRIDSFDHQGIYNLQKKNYSHKLRIIKRIVF